MDRVRSCKASVLKWESGAKRFMICEAVNLHSTQSSLPLLM